MTNDSLENSNIRSLLISFVSFALWAYCLRCYRAMPFSHAPNTNYMFYFYFALLSILFGIAFLSRAMNFSRVISVVLNIALIWVTIYAFFLIPLQFGSY